LRTQLKEALQGSVGGSRKVDCKPTKSQKDGGNVVDSVAADELVQPSAVVVRRGNRRGAVAIAPASQRHSDDEEVSAVSAKADGEASSTELVRVSTAGEAGRRGRRGGASASCCLSVSERVRQTFQVKVSIKTPTVIERVRVARTECLEAWLRLHDWQLYGASHRKFLARQKHLRHVLHQATIATQSRIEQVTRTKAQQQRLAFVAKQLEHATHEEFGMTVLQSLYRDVLDPSTSIGRRFTAVLDVHFPIDMYVSETFAMDLDRRGGVFGAGSPTAHREAETAKAHRG